MILALLLSACSSPSRPSAPAEDVDGGTVDTSAPPAIDSAAAEVASDSSAGDTHAADTRATETGDPITEKVPVGKACKSDGECDSSFDGVGRCGQTLFPASDPSPVCLAQGCKIGVGAAIGRCGAGNVGVCVGMAKSAICFPSCSFDTADGAAAVGCLGKNACNFYGVDSSSGTKRGIGYCSGGCVADGDCTGGGVCQVEDGVCVAELKAYPKAVGASCTTEAECACRTDAKGTKGFCTKFCLVGSASAACPAGFACDANLPSAEFTKTAAGLAGECRPECTTDAQCAPLGMHCETSVGVCRS